MEHSPYGNSNPDQITSIWQACHDGMAERWDPELADGMNWQEFDERSKTMSISTYLHYESRQAPMFSEREDQTIADAFGEDFARELRDIHEGRYDVDARTKKQGRVVKFVSRILSGN